MTKIRNLTGKAAERSYLAHERHQARMRENELYAGRLTVLEAAGMAHVSRQAITKRIRLGTLPAIQGRPGLTSEYWISPADLSRAYPPSKRKNA